MSRGSRDAGRIAETEGPREAKAQTLEKPAGGAAGRADWWPVLGTEGPVVGGRGGGWALETWGTVCPGHSLLESHHEA